MFADNTRIQFNTSADAIFLVNKELDVAIVSLQRPAERRHLNLCDNGSVDMTSPVQVMGYCQKTGLLNCNKDNKLAAGVEESFIFYDAHTESDLTGAPVLQKRGKDGLATIGVHNSYSTRDEFPSMATTTSAIRNWLHEADSQLPDGLKGKIRELLMAEKYECEEDGADEPPTAASQNSSENEFSSN